MFRQIACIGVVVLALAAFASAQAPLPAVDVTAADVQNFLKALPRDAVSDRPIRVVDVGGYRIGVYGVFRPKDATQDAIVHEATRVSEIYYVLEGTGTLVTGGALAQPTRETKGNTGVTARSARVEGGVSRRIGPGDIVIIPGGTPHWWSAVEGDLTYLIFRPDPEAMQPLK